MERADDSTMNTTATRGVRSYPHRPRRAVLVMVIAASLAMLLPNAAHAHGYVSGATGVGGAEINLSPDGYPHGVTDPGEPYHFGGRDYTVEGRGFVPGDRVLIFQCPVTRTAPVLLECEQLRVVDAPFIVAPTSATGTFKVDVHMDDRFTSVTYPNGACYGPDFGTSPLVPRSVQCSVVALSYDRTGTISRMAEHYVCFTGMFIGPGPTDTKCYGDH